MGKMGRKSFQLWKLSIGKKWEKVVWSAEKWRKVGCLRRKSRRSLCAEPFSGHVGTGREKDPQGPSCPESRQESRIARLPSY